VLAEIVDERFFRAGTPLFLPGRPVASVHLIRRGRVGILREGIAVRSFGPGGTVGALAALARDPTGQHVVAVEDTHTFEANVDDFEDVLEESFPTLLGALRGMARNVLEVRKQLGPSAGFREPKSRRSPIPSRLGLVERILFLRRLLAYGKAKIEAIAELAREAEEVNVPAGTVLWQAGEPARYSLLVVAGEVQCEAPDGQRFILGDDSQVGGIDSIAGVPRWYNAVALTEVVALRSEVTHLLDVIEDYPDMGLEMLRVVGGFLMRLQSELYERKVQSDAR
jgi:CRP-like cAMP-binding protein